MNKYELYKGLIEYIKENYTGDDKEEVIRHSEELVKQYKDKD